jgi:lipoate---protein ligase
MKCLDLTLPTPTENLACDEALLDWCGDGLGEEILRFWEPQSHFVVVGYGNHASREVNRQACDFEKLPILRRCSGGGTVLQGPGCLNYALILKIDERGQLRSISAANRFIMERNRVALDALLRDRGERLALPPSAPGAGRQELVEVRGHTDLAIGGLKFSGNAQRRKRHWLLFHGTFLLRFDLALMERFLPLPTQEPEYRRRRAHGKFLVNLGLNAMAVKGAMRQAWQAQEPLGQPPSDRIGLLVRGKYVKPEWNMRFP